jgi:regulator of sirC expression with transglutaminase-like and TPR domain
MATPAHFGSLLRLLDDENEEVQQGVRQALLEFDGDASHDLAALGITLENREARLLSRSLHAGRQKQLKNQWVVPDGKLQDPEGDYEAFESLLRLISDYLHDGVTLRPSLSDLLDLLAEEAQPEVDTPLGLARWLFGSRRLKGNRANPFDPRNSDLTWCLEEEQSNPIGLSIIYLLIAQRLDLTVHGINYPGHFLTLIDTPEGPTLIDAFHEGRPIPVATLLIDHPELSSEARKAVRHPCAPGLMLLRVLNNLNLAFLKTRRHDDAAIVQKLMKSLTP